MLTRKQLDLLEFIHRRMQKDGVPPSFDEMKEALDLRSNSGIHRLITALEERGFIRRLAHRARAIEIIRLPDSLAEDSEHTGFQPRVIDGDLKPVPRNAMPIEPELPPETRSGRPSRNPATPNNSAGVLNVSSVG